MASRTKNPVGRSPAAQRRDLRAELLRTSRELLDEGGPSALSMREVARRAGCTHQAPYHHFANREAILAALVAEGFDTLAERMRHVNDEADRHDLRETVEASANAYIEFALGNPGVSRVMFRPDMCSPDNFPRVGEAADRARGELTRLARIVCGPKAPVEAETVLWAYVHGLASLLLDSPLSRGPGEHSSLSTFAGRTNAVGAAVLSMLGDGCETGGNSARSDGGDVAP